MKQEDELSVRLRPWSEGDFPLLEKLMGDPEMTVHLGGPENAEQIADRHIRYLEKTDPSEGQMFAILVGDELKPVGSVGYWEKEWRGQQVYEIGWSVIPAAQGKGIATKATKLLLMIVRSHAKHRFVHAFPLNANGASNAVCRRVGLTFIEESDFEYPKGNLIRCNDWRLDLLESDE